MADTLQTYIQDPVTGFEPVVIADPEIKAVVRGLKKDELLVGVLPSEEEVLENLKHPWMTSYPITQTPQEANKTKVATLCEYFLKQLFSRRSQSHYKGIDLDLVASDSDFSSGKMVFSIRDNNKQIVLKISQRNPPWFLKAVKGFFRKG
jgi:hypothetical protein